MSKKFIALFATVFLLLFFHSCESPFSEDIGKIVRTGDIIEGTGTIIFLGFEGGFYGIVTANNGKWDPINLPSSFHIDGLHVRFKAKTRKDLGSYHMWGEIIELIYVEKK
ncbi:MAG TPA: hypothetical protein ENH65_09365 [Candidatus Aminicenantes bacterium]|nr:hypothetical protein [Candidatus Aminicenantes bacterium]HEB36029.1 hypothetical protein [Candidatus Aminicenantes bacterium]